VAGIARKIETKLRSLALAATRRESEAMEKIVESVVVLASFSSLVVHEKK
jgi:hypothetical protein